VPDRIVLVEWPERAPGLLPAERIDVSIEGVGASPRTVRVTR
jgi:tRNA A37 threonylcarbamoyladenosine biosynthesis protein TsaE